MASDNRTCDPSADACTDFKVFASGTSNYYCVAECTTVLSNAASACLETCDQFRDNISSKNTKQCVGHCASGFSHAATKLCIAECEIGQLFELVATTTYSCVANCTSFQLDSTNQTCLIDPAACTTFRLFVNQHNYQCL